MSDKISLLAKRIINSGLEYSTGGHLHIKPENRGKFTALKERTGHSATWFKEHGTPSQKKMAVFALNSRHWNHGDGGFIRSYDMGGPTTNPEEERRSRISNDRYKMAYDALVRSGESEADSARLAGFLGAQSLAEAGWVESTPSNNYGGYMSNGKKMKFDSPESFWDYHVKNLGEKWPLYKDARTIDDYYNAINHAELGLDTPEKYRAYNKNHVGNEVYLYAPAWENTNYLGNLRSLYNKRVVPYIPALKMRFGGNMNKYDGLSRGSSQMNTDDDDYLYRIASWQAAHPGQLWADTPKASSARQWLAQNRPDDFASMYWAEDEDTRRGIDPRFIPERAKERSLEDAVRTRDAAAPYVAGALAAPFAIDLAATAVPALYAEAKATAPLWGKAAGHMLRDLPAFEVIDRLPTLFGGKRITEAGGDATQWAAEKIAGKPLSGTGAVLSRLPGEFALGALPGVAGDMLMRTGSNLALRGMNALDNGIANGITRRAAAKLPDIKTEGAIAYRVVDDAGLADIVDSGVIRPNQSGPYAHPGVQGGTWFSLERPATHRHPTTLPDGRKVSYRGRYVIEIGEKSPQFPAKTTPGTKDLNYRLGAMEIDPRDPRIRIYDRKKGRYLRHEEYTANSRGVSQLAAPEISVATEAATKVAQPAVESYAIQDLGGGTSRRCE